MTAAITVLASLTSLVSATTTGKANCVTYVFAIRTARTMDTASTALVTVLVITLGNNVKLKYVKTSAPDMGTAWSTDCVHAAGDGKARTVAKLFAHRKTSSRIVLAMALVFNMCTLLQEMVPKALNLCRNASAPKATQVPHVIYEPAARSAKIVHIQIATMVSATVNKALVETFVLKPFA